MSNLTQPLRRANQLRRRGQMDAAAQGFRACTRTSPDHPDAWLGLGHCLRALGRKDDAVTAYRRCRELAPLAGAPWYALADIRSYCFDEREIAAMRHLLTDPQLTAPARSALLFALARAVEQQGDYPAAWQYFTSGNAACRTRQPWIAAQSRAMHAALARRFSRQYLEGAKGAGILSVAPVFIVGLPRSGTGLVEQILASHSRMEGLGELPYMRRLLAACWRPGNGAQLPTGAPALRETARSYLQEAGRHRLTTAPVFIDKMPENYSCIGFIHALFPRARFIDVRRCALDTAVANLRQLYARGRRYSYSQADMAAQSRDYQQLMQYWDDTLCGRILRVQY